MKQSTCRCFHRENELPFRWKSTRRDATSAAARPPPAALARAVALARAQGCRAPPQLAVRVRDERRAVSNRPQSVDREQHLVLTAAPGACGVNVKGEHRGGWLLVAGCWSLVAGGG